MDLGIQGKSVLVIGASKGIGRDIALSFSEEGGIVTAVARSENLLQSLAKELESRCQADHAVFSIDLMQQDNTEWIKDIISKRGMFDIVVHNVGGSEVSRDPLGSYEEWNYAWRFNAGLAVELNHILIPHMVAKGWGRVVHISSISAKMLRGNPLYASAKAFLNAYVTTVGRSLASSGIVLSAVMPGAVKFPGSYWDNYTNTDPARCEDFLRHHQAINRFGTPRDISSAVLFMASTQAAFMPAALIPVDGANM